MTKKKINKETYDDGVQEQIEEFFEKLFLTLESVEKYEEENKEEPFEIDQEALLKILESCFIMLFHEKNCPLELLPMLFQGCPKYGERVSDIIVTQILDKMVDDKLLVKISDEDGGPSGYMDVGSYKEQVGIK